jgi:hypothetical protein
MAIVHFQCPNCGFGDYEVGHLVTEADTYCVVCLESEEGRQVRVFSWTEPKLDQARLREALAA